MKGYPTIPHGSRTEVLLKLKDEKYIACLGSNEGKPGDPIYDAMVEVGRLIAQRGDVVVTGGFGGVGMEAPCRGAREVGGITIGFTFGDRTANEFVVHVEDCREVYHCADNAEDYSTLSRLDIKPPPIEVQYGIRLGNLLTADGFVVAATADLGMFVEIFAILNLSVKVWKEPKRVALLIIQNPEKNPLNRVILENVAKSLNPGQDVDITKLGVILRSFEFVYHPTDAVAWATGEMPLAQP